MGNLPRLPAIEKNSKIIKKIFGGFGKNSYLCIVDAKRIKASKNCGITMEKIFPSARGSSASYNRKIKD